MQRKQSLWLRFNQNLKGSSFAAVADGSPDAAARSAALARWFDRDNRGELGQPCSRSPAAAGNLLVDYSLPRRQYRDLMRGGRYTTHREGKSRQSLFNMS